MGFCSVANTEFLAQSVESETMQLSLASQVRLFSGKSFIEVAFPRQELEETTIFVLFSLRKNDVASVIYPSNQVG